LIEEVRVRNFLSHAGTDVKLDEGVNVFVGPNGAGKSSMIDAITFALFGKHMRGNNVNVVRKGTPGAEVEVRFTVGGSTYLAARGLDSAGKLVHAELRRMDDGYWKLMVAGERRKVEAEAVSAQVERVLGIGFKELKLASIVQQGELDSVLNLEPRELKELINRLVGIDDLDRAFNASHDVIEGFKGRLRDEIGFSVDDVERLEGELKGLGRTIEESRERVGAVKDQLEKLEAEENRLREELDRMEPLREKAQEAANKLSALLEYVIHLREDSSRRLRELKDLLSEAPSRLEAVSRRSSVEEELTKVRGELNSVEEELTKVRGELKAAQTIAQRVRELEDDVASSRRKLANEEKELRELEESRSKLGSTGDPRELEERRMRLNGSIGDLKEKRGGIQGEISNLRILKETGKCPTCGRSIEELNVDERLPRLTEQLKGIDEEIRRLTEQLKGIDEEIRRARNAGDLDAKIADSRRKLDNRRDELEERQKRLEAVRASAIDVGALRNREEELSGRRNALKDDEATLGKELSAIEGAAAWLSARGISGPGDLERLRSEASSIEELLSRMPADPRSSDLTSLSLDPRSSDMVQEILSLRRDAAGYDDARYRELGRKRESILGERALLMRELGEAETRLRDAEETRGKYESALLVLRNARKYVDLYDSIKKRIFHRDGALASALRAWAIDALSAAASDHIRMFGMGISTVQLSEGEDVEISCYGRSGEMDVKAMSGGERVAVALALRFAMARLVGGKRADFIILDEPTANLDQDRRRSLVDLVARMGNRAGPLRQIIVITHDREIFEESDVSAVFSFSRDAAGSSVTRIA